VAELYSNPIDKKYSSVLPKTKTTLCYTLLFTVTLLLIYLKTMFLVNIY
jgi:hypothetical protein